MTKKISEYFKIKPKSDEEIPKSSSIRDCKVVLNDIKIQAGGKDLKLFEEVTLNQKPKSKRNKCPICSTTFRGNFLEQHMKTKHPDGQAERFECDYDGEIFKRRILLWNHMKTHLPLIKCQFCHKMLKRLSMNIHLKNFHSTEQEFQCKTCSKSFKTAQYLYYHEKIHNKVHKCDICNKVFSYPCKLKQHKKEYHENTKSYECEICSMKFNNKTHLKNHQKTHDKNRPKPFKCFRCEFASDIQHNLNIHQKSHDRQDEKFAAIKNPIKCEKCSAFFKDKKGLSYHKYKVHPKGIFQCDLCANFIKNKSSLISHMKLHIKNLTKF